MWLRHLASHMYTNTTYLISNSLSDSLRDRIVVVLVNFVHAYRFIFALPQYR